MLTDQPSALQRVRDAIRKAENILVTARTTVSSLEHLVKFADMFKGTEAAAPPTPSVSRPSPSVIPPPHPAPTAGSWGAEALRVTKTPFTTSSYPSEQFAQDRGSAGPTPTPTPLVFVPEVASTSASGTLAMDTSTTGADACIGGTSTSGHSSVYHSPGESCPSPEAVNGADTSKLRQVLRKGSRGGNPGLRPSESWVQPPAPSIESL